MPPENPQQGSSEPITGSTTPSSTGLYDPQKEIQRVEKDIERVNYFFIGLVIFVAVTFLIEIYTMNLDRIKDKDLYLKYNDLYQQYAEKNSELGEKIFEQRIEINNFKNELELLRAKNQYLK